MRFSSKAIFTILTFTLVISPVAFSQSKIEVVDEVFDFGHVGIEFRILHDFKLINKGTETLWIDSTEVPCDCSFVRYSSDSIAPGDTGVFKLTFDTKDFYGPINRQFSIFVSAPEKRTFKLFYLAIVGQWVNGLMPEPFSLFMLPTHKSQTLRIFNKYFDNISVEIMHQFEDAFAIEIANHNAEKGHAIEIKVVPSPNLTEGTYLSNFTLRVENSLEEEPTFLTIPVKIARF